MNAPPKKHKTGPSQLLFFVAVVALSALANLSTFANEIVTLDGRPDAQFDDVSIDHLRGEAAKIGWGGLFYNHSMTNMSSDYLARPWISAAATPFLPTTFFLESRAWAVKHKASPAEADGRLLEIFRNPNKQMIFSFIFISEAQESLEKSDLSIVFESGSGRSKKFEMLEYIVTTEHAMGGKLYAARGRFSVNLPTGHDWTKISSFSLTVQHAGGDPYRLGWRLPNPQ